MNIVLWIVQILLGLLFVFSGVMKFIMPYEEMAKGTPVNLPHAFFLFIGISEILGGIGLVVPWLTKIKPFLTPLAAALLVIIMIGAVVITSMTPTPAMAVVPGIVGLLCAFIWWGRKTRS